MADISFDTYDELKAAAASWLHRTDLTSAVPAFIKLNEASMQRVLKTGEQEATATVVVAQGATSVTLPTGFQKLRRLRYLYGGVYTDLFPLSLAPSFSDGVTPTPPIVASMQGSVVALHNPTDTAYTFVIDYYGKFSPLSSTNTTNWILQDHPDAYLYGTLLQSAPFLGTDNRIQLWEGAFKNVIDEINTLDFQKRSSQLQRVSDIAWGGRRGYGWNYR